MTSLALPTAPRRAPHWAGWAFPVLVAAAVAAFLVATPLDRVALDGLAAPGPALVAAGALSAVAVLVAHRHPLLATGVAALPFALSPWASAFVWGWLLALVGVMVVAAARRWQSALPAWAAAVAVAAVYCSSDTTAVLPIGPVTSGYAAGYGTTTLVVYVVAFTVVLAVAAVLGAAPRTWARQRAAAVQERRAFEVEHVASERARMARDLHDVVAHHVSLIAVRAESAPYQHPGLEPAAREVLAAIAEDARAAIGELRHALTVLRRTDDATPDGTDGPDRRPQPDADAVRDLLGAAAGAGQPIRATGEWHDVPATQGYVLYRAVQEGLTNARRHSPGAAVVLARTQEGGRVGFVMSNATTGPAGPPGRGLLGMRERVAALGGTLHADVDAGRFVLSVDLPDGGPR